MLAGQPVASPLLIRPHRVASSYVLFRSDGLKVLGVAAGGDAAQVVNQHPLRYLATEKFPSNPMC